MDTAMSTFMTRRSSLPLPTLGYIRKGGEKVKKQRADGSWYETVGADLGPKFRVVFTPGNQGADQAFFKAYGTFMPERIIAVLPFAQVQNFWSAYNEAYTFGRMVARADDEHYLTLRDPITGEYQVRNGEPYQAFTPGDKVEYDQKGRHMVLPIKPVGRLRVFLPCFARLALMELKTSSFYDCINISSQLEGIRMIADSLNHGSVAGIPVWIYRRPTPITYTKPDGSASRVEKWLISIEADPTWVTSAINKMRQMAYVLDSGGGPALLEPGAPIESAFDPELDEPGGEEDKPEDVRQAEKIKLGSREMAELSNDELMLLTSPESKSAQNIKDAAGCVLNWRIEHGDNGYDGGEDAQ